VSAALRHWAFQNASVSSFKQLGSVQRPGLEAVLTWLSWDGIDISGGKKASGLK
jgi:hypothetical protein